MTFKSLTISFVILLVPMFAAAEKFCVGDIKEWQNSKGKLPEIMQRLPLILVKKGLMLNAAISVKDNGKGRLIMEAFSSFDPEGTGSEPLYIKEACFDDSKGPMQMRLKFENQEQMYASLPSDKPRKTPNDKTVEIIGSTSVSVMSVTLQVTEEKEYKALVAKLREKATRATTASDSSSGIN